MPGGHLEESSSPYGFLTPRKSAHKWTSLSTVFKTIVFFLCSPAENECHRLSQQFNAVFVA